MRFPLVAAMSIKLIKMLSMSDGLLLLVNPCRL